jgi:hypothetical protein
MRPQATQILARALPELAQTSVRAGFRVWQVIEGELYSPYRREHWGQAVQRATCDRPMPPAPDRGTGWFPATGTVPHPDCVCGIHVSAAPDIAYSQVNFRGVTGIVTVWGGLQREPGGVRAEYAKVAALGIYEHWTARQRDAVRRVALRLEADTLDLYDLPAAASMYGTGLPAPRGLSDRPLIRNP